MLVKYHWSELFDEPRVSQEALLERLASLELDGADPTLYLYLKPFRELQGCPVVYEPPDEVPWTFVLVNGAYPAMRVGELTSEEVEELARETLSKICVRRARKAVCKP